MTSALIAVNGGNPNPFGYFISPSFDTSGATDTAIFMATYAKICANLVLSPDGASYTAFGTITLGAGPFYINQAQAMIAGATPDLKCSGIKWQGQGSNLTYVVYNPTVSGPLIQNQRWINPQFAGISFFGLDPNSDWMQSQEQGGLSNVQYPDHPDVQWSGQWRNIEVITGGNNNSERCFRRCYVSTSALQNWIYVPGPAAATVVASQASIAISNTLGGFDVGTTFTPQTTLGNLVAGTYYQVLTSTTSAITIGTLSGAFPGSPLTPSTSGTVNFQSGSDQTLNMWFMQCKFWPVVGSWINMAYGGHIKIQGCDVSGWAPTASTYLFNLLGNTHSYGVCTFLASGLRVEHKSDNALLMHTQWNQGNIIFDGLDQSSQVQSRTASVQYFLNDTAQVAGAQVEFRNSQLIGTHMYNTGSNNYEFQTGYNYVNCTIMQQKQAALFALWNNGTNAGGAPPIHFDENCRSYESFASAGYRTVFASDVNASQGMGALTRTKCVNLCGAQNNMPINNASLEWLFPQNAAITRVSINKPAGGNGGAWALSLQSTDATPVVYASFSGTNAALAISQDTDDGTPIYVPLGTATTWLLTLTDTADRTLSMFADFIVYYIY